MGNEDGGDVPFIPVEATPKKPCRQSCQNEDGVSGGDMNTGIDKGC